MRSNGGTAPLAPPKRTRTPRGAETLEGLLEGGFAH